MTEQAVTQRAMQAEADHIRTTERSRLRALVEGDMGVARTLHAPDFQLITPVGSALSKEQYLGAIAAGHLKYLLWEPESIEVRLHGPVALIRYRARLEVVFAGHHVPAAQYWHTDSYEQRDGGWQAVWSQATEIK
ncbi:MAG: nuclear transport factor 2 family protein [Pseudomonadota bacterium]